MTDDAKPPSPSYDPLALAELFAGGGEGWLPLLRPVLERLPNAGAFIGPGRGKGVVPVRELTFQALKPNPPEKWKVVVFGQNPYPRVESATGIAMLDNTFHEWKDGRFGRVTSVRCIIKAALIWKEHIPKATTAAEMRAMLARGRVVQPPEWFQAMLAQGVLLLNAALTASSDGAMLTEQHTAFWRPVVEKVIDEILRAKQAAADPADRGVVFAWWGAHARGLRGVVDSLSRKYPGVKIRHVDHCNPAAMADAFCDGDHFGDLNRALGSVGSLPVDWLPAEGWAAWAAASEGAPAQAAQVAENAERMGAFVTRTRELHKLYLERLGDAAEEKTEALSAIEGVMASPLMGFGDAIAPVGRLLGGLEPFVKRAAEFAAQARGERSLGLDEHQIAAVHLYTTESQFYRRLNAALRERDRARVEPFFAYLRLLLSALSALPARAETLYRGVPLDLRGQYPRGRSVVWWGVSSCTTRPAVARGFLGAAGRRTLFEIAPRSAVSIKPLSAFTGEEEVVLLPGTQLRVGAVRIEPGGLSVVRLEELSAPRLVS